MSELPVAFYYITGFLILSNLGSIGTLLMLGFKATWFVSKLDSKVTAAHDRLDRLEVRLGK